MESSLTQPTEAVLVRNLAALESVDPHLVERLSWPVASDHVTRTSDGGWRYRIHRTWHVLEPEVASAQRHLDGQLDLVSQGGGSSRRALVLSCGAGEFLELVLGIEGLREIRVWDRDPWLLRLMLGRLDLSGEIASRRLRLLLTTDLVGVRSAGSAVIEHPFLGRIYARERAHLDDPAPRGVVALAAGGLFVEQLGRELFRRGYGPWTLDLSLLSVAEVEHCVRSLAPRFLIAVNYTQGLAQLAHEFELDTLVWEVDPASAPPRSEGVPTERVKIFTHSRANLRPWRDAGFTHVEYLPLAADPEVRRGSEASQKDLSFGVSFVGQSLVDNARILGQRFLRVYAAWRERDESVEAEGRALLDRLVALQGDHFGRFVIPAALGEFAPGLREAAVGALGMEDPAVLAGEVASAHKRFSVLAALGEFAPHIWGDEGWGRLKAEGARYHGPAGHGAELTEIYDRSTVNLDVGRLYQADIVTMRVFDALSTGSLVLTELNDALGELFAVDSEVATYRNREELVGKVRYYLDHPRAALELAARGREAVHARHTIAHRVDRMLHKLEI